MTEIKKSSDVYGGSLGLQTTVNIGVKLLKPITKISHQSRTRIMWEILTPNREFGAARHKLKEVTSLRQRQFAHSLEQVANALAVHVETVVSFDRIQKR
jgi:hypothetical protein